MIRSDVKQLQNIANMPKERTGTYSLVMLLALTHTSYYSVLSESWLGNRGTHLRTVTQEEFKKTSEILPIYLEYE